MRKTLWRMFCLALLAPALVPAAGGAAPAAAQVMHAEKSLYRDIFVYEERGVRCLRFRRADTGSRQTCMDLAAPQRLVLTYAKMMLAALYLQPEPSRILIIGLGGGTLPMALRSVLPGAEMDVVEIDPAVVRVARAFFGFREDDRLRVHEQDGRVFVRRAAQDGSRYDLVMLDAFNDEYIPEHLLTREFLQEVKSILAPGGVLAANTFSSSGLYPSESATYADVYGTFYNLDARNRVILAQPDGLTDFETVAANAEALADTLAPFDIDPAWLLRLMTTERNWNPDARVLTDQYSPSNLLNSR